MKKLKCYNCGEKIKPGEVVIPLHIIIQVTPWIKLNHSRHIAHASCL